MLGYELIVISLVVGACLASIPYIVSKVENFIELYKNKKSET